MRKGPGKDEERERRNEIRTMTGKNIYEMHDFYVMGGMFNERSVGQMCMSKETRPGQRLKFRSFTKQPP